MNEENVDITTLTVELVSSYVSNNDIRPDDLPAFIASMHAAISGLGGSSDVETTPEAAADEHVPAVTARKSLASKDHIVSMIDGKPYKTLRRHLSTHGLTPAEYRERYKLKPDYPMVAESYSTTRRELAQKIGLGRKVKAAASAVADTVTDAVEEVAESKPVKAVRKKLSGTAALAKVRGKKDVATD